MLELSGLGIDCNSIGSLNWDEIELGGLILSSTGPLTQWDEFELISTSALVADSAGGSFLVIDKVLQQGGFNNVTLLHSLPFTNLLDLDMSVGWYLSDFDKVWWAVGNGVQVLNFVSVDHLVRCCEGS